LAAPLALLLCGCDDSETGPLLQAGDWHAVIQESNGILAGTATFQADASGKLRLHASGTFMTDNSPFTIDSSLSLLREGADFPLNGTVGGAPIQGYGRARIYIGTVRAIIPVDSLPQHALTVGDTPWEFELEGGINATQMQGTWITHTVPAIEGLSGVFIAAPGPLPPPDAADDGEVDAGVGDAPADAATD
jgi:hypothetical protein